MQIIVEKYQSVLQSLREMRDKTLVSNLSLGNATLYGNALGAHLKFCVNLQHLQARVTEDSFNTELIRDLAERCVQQQKHDDFYSLAHSFSEACKEHNITNNNCDDDNPYMIYINTMLEAALQYKIGYDLLDRKIQGVLDRDAAKTQDEQIDKLYKLSV